MRSLLLAMPQCLQRFDKLAEASLVPIFISNSLSNIHVIISSLPSSSEDSVS